MENKLLQISNLNAFYPGSQILKNLSFTVEPGDFICLCGPNGCGKSTLLNLLAGIPSASLKFSGDAKADGKQIREYKPKELAQKIAFMAQNESIAWNFSVEDIVLSGRYSYTKNGYYSNHDREVTAQVIEQLGLSSLSKKSVHEISGGEFQKVRIARALAQEPSFLLLDEPANNLDFTYEPKLMELLLKLSEEKQLGILLSIHDINMAARFAKKLLLLPPGSPAFFGPEDNVLTEENLLKTYNQKLQIYTHPVYNKKQIY